MHFLDELFPVYEDDVVVVAVAGAVAVTCALDDDDDVVAAKVMKDVDPLATYRDTVCVITGALDVDLLHDE